MTKAIVFPGQGAQTSGMCNELYHTYPYVKNLYDRFDEAVGSTFSKKLLDGDAEVLRRTSLTQMALFLSAASVWTVLKREVESFSQEVMFSGHSVGEFGALFAAEALDFVTASKLIFSRGKCMEESQAPGGLVALLGGGEEDVVRLVEAVNQRVQSPCMISGYNGMGQHVVGGPLETLDVLREIVAEFPIKKAVPLPVTGPFHTSYMCAAQEAFQEELEASRATIEKLRKEIDQLRQQLLQAAVNL